MRLALLVGALLALTPVLAWLLGRLAATALPNATAPLAGRPSAALLGTDQGHWLVSLALALLAATALALRRPRHCSDCPAAPMWASAPAELVARAAQTGGQGEDAATLAAVLRAANGAILLCDAAGTIERFNPAAEMLFGQLAEEVIGRNFATLILDDEDELDPQALAILAAEANGGQLVREALARRRGVQVFPVRLWIRRFDAGERWRLLICAEDLTEREQQDTQATYLRQHDLLTGLLNRREFERRLEIMLGDAGARQTPHALCFIDVDQLKLVNNACGHAAGDKLLQHLAALVQAKLAGSRILGRIGGDEFAALFVDRPSAEVLRICDDLLQTVRNFLFTWQDKSLDLAVSIGLILFTPEDESASTALTKADVACYVAKHKGRDRLHVYSDGDSETVRHYGDMHLVVTIGRALNDGRFRLFAQPIRALAEGAGPASHFEILVRMVDERGQLVIPDRFIPAAERYILMPAVDRWIIQHLFSTQAANLRRWHDCHPGFLFAVNLSGTSLSDEGFLRYLKRQFAEWAVPYPTICFEITETAAIGSLDQARALMDELGRLGCPFALDDFGSGLSSYLYLRDLPVSYLKIDGGFVRHMVADPVNRTIVESINQIGHVLGLETIAEWAEDETLIEALRGIGVDYAQGFGVGAPVPIEDFQLRAPDEREHDRPAVPA